MADESARHWDVSELGQWVALLVKRGGWRHGKGKREKDLDQAQNYLDYMQEAIHATRRNGDYDDYHFWFICDENLPADQREVMYEAPNRRLITNKIGSCQVLNIKRTEIRNKGRLTVREDWQVATETSLYD